MRKISKEELLSFNTNIVSVLSQDRLNSFEGDLQAYYSNRLLALKAGHKIAEIEIYLRNKLNHCLSILYGNDWILSKDNLQIIKPKNKLPLEKLSSNQILSSLMLGDVIDLIEAYRIESYMFELKQMDFKKYHWSNKNTCRINEKKSKFTNFEKNSIVFNLVRTIRNRAFHWENLYKTTYKENGDIYPRITCKKNGTTIGIMPEMILDFLDDLIDNINNPIIKTYKNIECNYKK